MLAKGIECMALASQLRRGGIRLKARNRWKPSVPVGKKDKAGGRGSGSGDYVSPGMLATPLSLIRVLTSKGWQYEVDTMAIRSATQEGARLSLAPAYFSSHLPVSHQCFLLQQVRSPAPAAFGVSLWLQSLGGDLQGKGQRSAQRETGGEADRVRPGQVLRLRKTAPQGPGALGFCALAGDDHPALQSLLQTRNMRSFRELKL